MPTVGMISLGCARNQVDSETMLGSLKRNGFEIVDVKDCPQVCIVNTCAFVKQAREESVEYILDAAALKKSGKIKYLIVCGCLPQLYKEKLAQNMPEADLVLGTGDFPRIADFIKGLGKKKKRRTIVSSARTYLYDEFSPRFLLTPKHYAYVKISEGCSNFCSYCIISRLRGPFRSRSLESVVSEVRRLSKGETLKEVILIGQDTTLFGLDRYGKAVFPNLLRAICGLKNSVRWVRVLYTHPAHYTDELIAVIRGEDKICKYLDLPVQHCSDRILKRMNRPTTKKHITELIDKLRRRIPRLILRTSVIVGFPGETDRDFKELLEFVKRTRFERLGAFLYSKEAGTKASRFQGQIPEKVKEDRMDELMRLQQRLSRDLNMSCIGKTMDVLIDEKIEGKKDKYLGRREGDAPEIDGGVSVTGRSLSPGKFYKVRITDALEYDLEGRAL